MNPSQITAILCASSLTLMIPIFKAAGEPRLPFDQPTAGEIDWANQSWQTYVVEVPEKGS
jgi:hypothetical protein